MTANTHRRPGIRVVAAAVALLSSVIGAAALTGAASSPSVPSFDHVFVVVMENHSSSSIIGSSSAPYINSLASQNGLATTYSAVAHPSLPNYLALTGASTFGITSDCTSCFISATNLADRIEASGRSWKAYMESMPSACYVGSSGTYAQKHDPWIYYDDIRTNATRCTSDVVPYSQLPSDLATAGSTPNFVWITPNLCHDMHDCSIATGDSWLKSNLPAIFTSPAWTSERSLLLLTWDENDGSAGNQVATVAIGSSVTRGYRSNISYTHYSLVKTIEQAWGLAPLTTNDGNASAMTDFFGGAPSPSPTPTVSPTPTASPTPRPTPSPSPSPSPSPTPTATPMPSPTPTPAPTTGTLFSDGFNSGSCAAWTACSGLTYEGFTVRSAPYAAEGSTTTGSTYAREVLGSASQDLYVREYAFLKSNSTNVTLLKLRDASGRALAHLYVNPSGTLGIRNDVTGTSAVSSAGVSLNAWHEVELHLTISGVASTAEVWLDGSRVSGLSSSTTNLGTAPIGQFEAGDNQTGRVYDLILDDVAAATTFLS